MAATVRRNSTNVRIESPLDPWPPRPRASCAPRVALALWSAVVAAAGVEGVFARLEAEAFAALVAFVVAFTLFAAWRDADVHAGLDRLPYKLATALMLDAAVVTSLAIARDGAWTGFAGAMALLVLLPLALVVHAAARTRRIRRAPGASPGVKRAAP